MRGWLFSFSTPQTVLEIPHEPGDGCELGRPSRAQPEVFWFGNFQAKAEAGMLSVKGLHEAKEAGNQG